MKKNSNSSRKKKNGTPAPQTHWFDKQKMHFYLKERVLKKTSTATEKNSGWLLRMLD
jgi:hypothetical protein